MEALRCFIDTRYSRLVKSERYLEGGRDRNGAPDDFDFTSCWMLQDQDPGSGSRINIQDPGSKSRIRIQDQDQDQDPGSRIRIQDPGSESRIQELVGCWRIDWLAGWIMAQKCSRNEASKCSRNGASTISRFMAPWISEGQNLRENAIWRTLFLNNAIK